MTTLDIIIQIFCIVDDEMKDMPICDTTSLTRIIVLLLPLRPASRRIQAVRRARP